MVVKVDLPTLKILDLIAEMFLQWLLAKLHELRMEEVYVDAVYNSSATFALDCEIKIGRAGYFSR